MDVYSDPMLTLNDAARYLGLSSSTLRNWVADGSVHRTEAEKKGWPMLPFVAAVEAYVLQQLRKMGISRQEIRDAATGIRRHLDDPYGLASPKLGVDGREILVDVAGEFYRGRDLQQAAKEAVTNFRKVITWQGEQPTRLRLENLGGQVILDPRFGWGRPVVESNKVPVNALAGQWLGGDSLVDIANDFGMDPGEVERVVQTYLASGLRKNAA